MIFPNGMLILLVVSLLLCAMGFYRFVWFMSVGYGISVAGIGTTLLIMALLRGEFSLIYLVECVLLVAYGIRLGGFLLIRELKNERYRAKARETGADVSVPIFVAFFMWVFCGVIYILQTAGPVYHLLNGLGNTQNVFLYVGVLLAVVGLVLEAEADKQKSEEKKINPNMPAMNGLYKLCRCPNYFGELLFWFGIFVSGFGSLQGAQWLVAVLGIVEITVVMLSGAKRMETRHIKHYGDKSEYQAYADHTPLIFPFVPLYHMTSPEKIAKEEAAKKAKADKRNKK